MGKIHGLDNAELKQSIARLSHFSPNSSDDYGHQVLDYILLDAMADNGTVPSSAKDLKNRIKENIYLDFEEDELVQAGKRLQSKSLITLIEGEKRFDKPLFQLNEGTEQDLSNNRVEISDLEKEVLDDWKSYLLEKYGESDELKNNLNRVVTMLQDFIARMFVRHGVETISLLYPDKATTKRWINENGFSILKELQFNGNEFLRSIVLSEVPLFFQKSNERRGQYLSNLFNSSFYWHLVQVDGNCSALLRESTNGQKLFLDNNILYSLIGLHGEDAMESAHTMLKYAKELGYVLLVTTKTIDEFHNTLNWRIKEFGKKTISADLAKVALDQMGETSFMTVFWRNLVDRGVSLREFVSEVSYLDDILEGLGITINNKFRKDIEESEDLRDEMSELRKACGDNINLNIVEHDSFHRILVRKYRKGNKYKFNDAKAWFLTQDHKLLKYSRSARKGETYLPFCITTNEWIQINRPLLTRTVDQDEFEKSFRTLVTQPSIRAMISIEPLEQGYNKILSRLDRFKNMDATMASRIISDIHFVNSIDSDMTDEELDEKIESRLLSLNKELRQKHEALVLEKKGEEKKVEKLQENLEALAAEIKENKGELNRTKSNFDKALDGYSSTVKNLKGEIDGKDQELEKRESEIHELKRRGYVEPRIKDALRKWQLWGYLAIIPLILLLAALFFTLFLSDWNANPMNAIYEKMDSEKGVRNEVYVWVTLLVLGSGLIFVGRMVVSRLFLKKEKVKRIKELTQEYLEEYDSKR